MHCAFSVDFLVGGPWGVSRKWKGGWDSRSIQMSLWALELQEIHTSVDKQITADWRGGCASQRVVFAQSAKTAEKVYEG